MQKLIAVLQTLVEAEVHEANPGPTAFRSEEHHEFEADAAPDALAEAREFVAKTKRSLDDYIGELKHLGTALCGGDWWCRGGMAGIDFEPQQK